MHNYDSSYHMDTRHEEDDETESEIHLEDDYTPMNAVMEEDEEVEEEKESHECPDGAGLVFSSLDTHFCPRVCLQQFVFHVFFPLTVPIAWYKHGMKHAKIQRYHWKEAPSYLFSYMPVVALVSFVVCLWADPDDVLTAEQLILPCGALLLQRLMISVKYASLSPDEYR